MPPARHPADDTPAEDSRCVQHTIALQAHESRLGHAEERIDVHDRTIFGFNGKEPGLMAKVQKIEDAAVEYQKLRLVVFAALLAGVLEGGVAIGIAVLR